VTFELLPLSDKGIRDFLGVWHGAARDEYADDTERQNWLYACQKNLVEMLANRPDLRRLAANPLLCGLLCMLYQDGNMHLPRDRRSLYEAALDLLLVRWDEQRGVVPDDASQFSKEQQTVLLQRFAYSMVVNGQLVMNRAEAAQRFGHAMRGLRSPDADPDRVLQRMLERTGLLREQVHGSVTDVQFVHRTFRDYLAAKEAVDAGHLKGLTDHAHNDEWHEVVAMAVAYARPSERAAMLRAMLEGNEAARRDHRLRRRLRLVAAACLGLASVIDPDEVRVEVEAAAAELIPPASATDAEELARAGEFVLDLLPGPEGLTRRQSAAVVRTAALIGGDVAWEKLKKFADVDNSWVIDELLTAWRFAPDEEEFARTVLSKVDFGDRIVAVQAWHRIRHVHYLAGLACLRCVGDAHPLDPIGAMPRLRRLDLFQNCSVYDLTPLTQSRTLRELRVTNCTWLRDLSPLARTQIDVLAVYSTDVDLSTLSGARVRRLEISHHALDTGLDKLPADLPLEELEIDNMVWKLNGIERWPGLMRVSVRGKPDADDVKALANLPALRHLEVKDVPANELAGAKALLRSLRTVGVRLNDRPL
jgi:hypothetical protein